MWKEKQVQVAKEEQRIRESMSKFGTSAQKRSQLTSRAKEPDGPTAIHLGRLIGAVHFRDVWTATAEILIGQVRYSAYIHVDIVKCE